MSKFFFETRQDADGFWRCRILHTSMKFLYGEAIAADEGISVERAKAMADGLERAYGNPAEQIPPGVEAVVVSGVKLCP